MEKSCGCIVFNKDKVLIEKSLSGYYGFPKGHIEKNETEQECALRETLEETGIKAKINPKYRFSIKYLVHEKTPKEVIYFISHLEGSEKITIQEEELSDAFWVNIEDVKNILSFDNLKKLWESALEVYNGKINI